MFPLHCNPSLVVNSFAGFYKNALMRNEVNSEKRKRLITEREKWRRELEEEVRRGEMTVLEVRSREEQGGRNIFQSFLQAEAELQLRITKDMTVADIIRIGH